MTACAVCGNELQGEFRFCPFCGSPVASAGAVEPVRERRVVSVLFCDVVGFTAASHDADPEVVRGRMEAYYSHVRPVIEGFGGTVEKFVGDAVLAVFGVPAAHEDDAERAVRAGLAIVKAIEELNEADPELQLSVRIGVNTGEVLAALDARLATGETSVLGDTVNTAARIQSAAPVGAVAVGEATFRSTEPVFDFEPLEPVVAKGKEELLPVWRAVAPRARLGSDVTRTLTTPLVGRLAELDALTGELKTCLDERSPRLVTIEAVPGAGKSRLLAELAMYADRMPNQVVWRQGRCLPYGNGITFWALGEIIKAHAGIYDSDSVEASTAKLEQVLPESDDRAWLRSRLLPLLGIEAGGAGTQQELFTAWRRFLEGIAQVDPLVLAVEDIHWADDALLAFLEHVTATTLGVPLLVVCTARPELFDRHATWSSGLANTAIIHLGPLSDEETARLVGILLDRAVLPVETQQLLIERSGGNPLYAEELVRTLRDRGLLGERGELGAEAQLLLPESLQALIASRLDTLPSDQKRLLQDAAVVGKSFWVGAAAAMSEREPREADDVFRELAGRELIRPAPKSTLEGESEYAFWHALVRDVAYAQIPRGQRASRHLHAASWIEQKAGERVEDIAEVLAYHTGEALKLARATGNAGLEAEVTPTAGRYALLAGERALGLDNGKALEFLGRARELVSADDPAAPRVLLRWASAAKDAGRFREADATLAEAASRFEDVGDAFHEAQALSLLGYIRRRLAEPDFLPLHERAVALLEPNPGPELVSALAEYVDGLLVAYEPEAGIATADRVLALASELGLPPPGWALSGRGSCRVWVGDVGGVADLERAGVLLVQEGNGKEGVFHNLAVARSKFEGPAAGLAAYDRSIAFAAARGLDGLHRGSSVNRVECLIELGRLEEAAAAAARVVPLLHEGGDRFFEGAALIALAHALSELGGDATGPADRAAELHHRSELGPRARFEAALARDDTGGVRSALDELVAQTPLKCQHVFLRLVRAAAAVGEPELVRRLVSRLTDIHDAQRQFEVTGAAVQAELARDYVRAARLYADGAERWKRFTDLLEHAYALLGQGRALTLLGDEGAEEPLRRAKALFEKMGAGPRSDECEALLTGIASRTGVAHTTSA
jgi:class 3 adenylate cyclase/tetratricopeptide (TPR) repeat protein